VRILVTKLSVDHKLPLKQINQLFKDRYGYDLNSTTIEEALERGYDLAAPIVSQIMVHLLKEDTVHFDEAGVRVAGQLHWLHTAATEHHIHRFIHAKRGTEALNSSASVRKDFKGAAVHDCWSPHFNFDEVRHVWCSAHLLRKLAGLKENGSWWAGERHEFGFDLYHGRAKGMNSALIYTKCHAPSLH
jgi:transposase